MQELVQAKGGAAFRCYNRPFWRSKVAVATVTCRIPGAKFSLAPGEHTLSLQLKGYKPLNKSIAVKKDTPLQIDESLEKQ